MNSSNKPQKILEKYCDQKNLFLIIILHPNRLYELRLTHDRQTRANAPYEYKVEGNSLDSIYKNTVKDLLNISCQTKKYQPKYSKWLEIFCYKKIYSIPYADCIKIVLFIKIWAGNTTFDLPVIKMELIVKILYVADT